MNRCQLFLNGIGIRDCNLMKSNKIYIETTCLGTCNSVFALLGAGGTHDAVINIWKYSKSDIVKFIFLELNDKGYVGVTINDDFPSFFPGHVFTVVKEDEDNYAVIQSYLGEYEPIVCQATKNSLKTYLENYIDVLQNGIWEKKQIDMWANLTNVLYERVFDYKTPTLLFISTPENKFDYGKCNHNAKKLLMNVRRRLKVIRRYDDVCRIMELEAFAIIKNTKDKEYINDIIIWVEENINIMLSELDQPIESKITCNIDQNGFLRQIKY